MAQIDSSEILEQIENKGRVQWMTVQSKQNFRKWGTGTSTVIGCS